MEYDTYPDPVGPITAGAQVLYGAIANFVTGLADVPTEVVNDLVAAGRALGHSHDRLDPTQRWRRREPCRNSDSVSRSVEFQNRDESARENERAQTSRPNDRSDSDEDIPGENEDEDEEMVSDDSESLSTDIVPNQSMERRRSLQLEKSQTMSSEYVPSKSHNVLSEVASLGGKMSKKFVNLLIWLPTDLTLSLSKGFHNAPKLYHDPMVKSTPKVHDIRSGFRAAGKVFAFPSLRGPNDLVLIYGQELYDGFYDGVTGLVTQPQYGYKHKGTKGMIKGVGKGLGGVFFKPPAGMTANPPKLEIFSFPNCLH